MKNLMDFVQALGNSQYRPTALRVALVVGTILVIINHGPVILQRKMTRQQLLSAALTYLVPYMVSVHGQYSSRRD